jgi:uncharacterized protein YneF (UPF0154 family)
MNGNFLKIHTSHNSAEHGELRVLQEHERASSRLTYNVVAFLAAYLVLVNLTIFGSNLSLDFALVISAALIVPMLAGWFLLRKFIKKQATKNWRFAFCESGIYVQLGEAGSIFSNQHRKNCLLIPTGNIDWIKRKQANSSDQADSLEIGLKRLELSQLQETLKLEKFSRRKKAIRAQVPLLITETGTLLLLLTPSVQMLQQLKRYFPILQEGITRSQNTAPATENDTVWHQQVIENRTVNEPQPFAHAPLSAPANSSEPIFTSHNELQDILTMLRTEKSPLH